MKCAICPTVSYTPGSQQGYMKPATLERILPLPKGVGGGDVDLTGWGEPLLNPHFPDILERLPGATFTTNATLMDDRWAERFIKAQAGAIAFSIDAATCDTYSKLHGGGDCETVWRNVTNLRRKRDGANTGMPILSAHFLLMKSNVSELVEFVGRAANAGMDEVVVKNVALFAKPAQTEEALFTGFFAGRSVDTARRDEILAKASQKAKECGITFRRYGANDARRVPDCFGGALARPFVSWDGRVSPCCVLSHSVARIAPDGSVVPGPEKFVGDLRVDSLVEIWDREDYVLHRKTIAEGGSPEACAHCLGLWSVTVEPVS